MRLLRPQVLVLMLFSLPVLAAACGSSAERLVVLSATSVAERPVTLSATPFAVQPPAPTDAATHDGDAPATAVPVTSTTAPVHSPAVAATVQALATKDASALPDMFARDALKVAGFEVPLGSVDSTFFASGERVLTVVLGRTPKAQADETLRRALLTLAQVSVLRRGSWDAIQILVEDEYQGVLNTAVVRASEVESWRNGRTTDDRFVALAIENGRERERQVRPPTPGPVAVSTAAAAATAAAATRDPAAVKITLADLPSDFQEMPAQSLAAIPNPFGPGITIQNRFGFTTLAQRVRG